MKRILILLGFVLGVLSAHAESKSYTINNMFTISVDSKLELRDKKGLYEQKTKNGFYLMLLPYIVGKLYDFPFIHIYSFLLNSYRRFYSSPLW